MIVLQQQSVLRTVVPAKLVKHVGRGLWQTEVHELGIGKYVERDVTALYSVRESVFV